MSGEATKIRDVVCGMMIDPERAAAVRTLGREKFYFCSAGCAKQFDADPHRFAHQKGK